MDINQLIAHRLRELRDARGLSLAALAERSGVSKSNISLIERGESSATATVLDKLSAALGVTVASLFEKPAEDAPSPVSRVADQPVWTDPGSGYVRRNLSPSAGLAKSSPIQLVEVSFPAGQRVAYETSTRDVDVYQQVWIIEGAMEVTVGASQWALATGDCLAMRLDQPIAYHNPTAKPARYLVSLVTQAHKAPRRDT
jgi:transcriptional regulator with XRE-family HTH domain